MKQQCCNSKTYKYVSRLLQGTVETSCYVALAINLNSSERLVNEYLNEIKLKTFYVGYTACFVMNVPILKPYISATTNPK